MIFCTNCMAKAGDHPVTHNAEFANEAQRVVRLQDGWVEKN